MYIYIFLGWSFEVCNVPFDGISVVFRGPRVAFWEGKPPYCFDFNGKLSLVFSSFFISTTVFSRKFLTIFLASSFFFFQKNAKRVF
ncbi:hypothetical protein LguiB_010519 [Lonicera macranthoides]